MDDPESFANEWYQDREAKADREAQAGDYYEERRRHAAAEAKRPKSPPPISVSLPLGGGEHGPSPLQRAQTTPRARPGSPNATGKRPSSPTAGKRVSFGSSLTARIAPFTPSEQPSPKGGPSISQAFHVKMISGYEAERRNAASDMQRTGFIIDPRRVKAMQKWDLLMVACLAFTAIVTPVEVRDTLARAVAPPKG